MLLLMKRHIAKPASFKTILRVFDIKPARLKELRDLIRSKPKRRKAKSSDMPATAP